MTMKEDSTPFSSYYGKMKDKLIGNNLSVHAVDEVYSNIIIKHETYLIELVKKSIDTAKEMFHEEIRSFKQSLNLSASRIDYLEKYNAKKQKKEADKKRKLENINKEKEPDKVIENKAIENNKKISIKARRKLVRDNILPSFDPLVKYKHKLKGKS
jgi:hypothetical protein